jgi:hypothetical protein
MKISTLILCLTTLSLSAFAQHENHAGNSDSKIVSETPATFKNEKLGDAYANYILLKDALVASNETDAKKVADELVKVLKKLKDSDPAVQAATKILNATTLSEQRLAFSPLSDEMAKLVKGGKLSSGALYLEYCPMANKNTGAYWLSNEKEIKNPYFGKMMLKCGSVKETIQ